ncbi:MAG: sensor histidine kinase [Actinomycetes bacterium]
MPTRLRIALIVLSASLALLTGQLGSALPWLAALFVVGCMDSGLRIQRPVLPAGVLVVEMVVLCAGIMVTGSGRSPLLPYLVAPLASAGRRYGNRGATLAAGLGAALAALFAWVFSVALGNPLVEVAVVQWLALGLASGLLAAWAERLRAIRRSDEQGSYAEAQRLLSQLRALAQRLPGSLDPSTAAEGLLDRCAQITPHERAVVLTRYDGNHLVPVAIRGVDRVPWRDPMSESGPLSLAWTEQRSVLDVRWPDSDPAGRRKGSALLVVPLRGADGGALGLAAFESVRLDAFDDAAVAAVEAEVRRHTPRVETALLFDDLRHTATLEERERLAREMHNGVAQDLAYFGFTLDDLRHRLADEAPEHAARVAEMRRGLTEMIQDIRLSITDLRSSVGPERGLGTALSSYVRHASSAAGLTVHLSLRESYFRLPSEQEMALFRLTQTFVTHVRKTAKAQNLWVSLETDPPTAALTLEHDGLAADESSELWSEADQLSSSIQAMGGSLSVTAPGAGRFRVDVTLTGGTPCRSDSSS